MYEKDEETIRALGEHFSSKACKKFKPRELDEEVWEEGLRLGYSDQTRIEIIPNESSEVGAINEKENNRSFAMPIRGLFEGNFIPLE